MKESLSLDKGKLENRPEETGGYDSKKQGVLLKRKIEIPHTL